jgi:hypothetical protein
MFMTSTNEMGIKGSSEYGGSVYPADFEPACDAYTDAGNGLTTYKTRAQGAFLDSSWQRLNIAEPSASLLHFIKHTTNQPLFGMAGMCNHQLRIFDTPISVGEYAPRAVKGAVRANIPVVSSAEMMWSEAMGVQISSAFVERHMIPCEEVQNWRYSGSEMDSQALANGALEL